MATRASTREMRAFSTQWEIREDGDKVGFRGYAAVFDSESHGEIVRRSAFAKTLSDRDPVVFLVNHDGVPIASSDAGTMTLGVDDRGLFVDADDLDMANPRVQEIVSAMKRKDLNKMSFAFVDRTPREERIDDDGVRNIRDVQLHDVSVVTFPWYPDTHAELNGLVLAAAEARSAHTAPERDDAKRAAMLLPDLFKRALNGWTFGDLRPLLWDAAKDAAGDNVWWLYILDVSDEWFVYGVEGPDGDDCFQVPYTVTAEGVVTLGTASSVVAKTTYISDPDADEDALEVNSAPWRLEAAKFYAAQMVA